MTRLFGVDLSPQLVLTAVAARITPLPRLDELWRPDGKCASHHAFGASSVRADDRTGGAPRTTSGPRPTRSARAAGREARLALLRSRGQLVRRGRRDGRCASHNSSGARPPRSRSALCSRIEKPRADGRERPGRNSNMLGMNGSRPRGSREPLRITTAYFDTRPLHHGGCPFVQDRLALRRRRNGRCASYCHGPETSSVSAGDRTGRAPRTTRPGPARSAQATGQDVRLAPPVRGQLGQRRRPDRTCASHHPSGAGLICEDVGTGRAPRTTTGPKPVRSAQATGREVRIARLVRGHVGQHRRPDGQWTSHDCGSEASTLSESVGTGGAPRTTRPAPVGCTSATEWKVRAPRSTPSAQAA